MGRSRKLDAASALFHDVGKGGSGDIVLVIDLDGIPSDKLIETRVARIPARFPIFRSLISGLPGTLGPAKVWKPIKIDMTQHLLIQDCGCFDKDAFDTIITQVINTPLNPKFPLWRFHFIKYGESSRSFCIIKAGHCQGDGTMLAHVLTSICDSAPPNRHKVQRPPVSYLYQAYAVIRLIIILLFHYIWRKHSPDIEEYQPDKTTMPHDMKIRYLHLAEWDIATLKSKALERNVSVNDILLAVLFRGVALYRTSSTDLSSLSVFTLRESWDVTSLDVPNAISAIVVPMKTKGASLNDILQEVNRLTTYYKTSPLALYWALGLKTVYKWCPAAARTVVEWVNRHTSFKLSSYATFLRDLSVGSYRFKKMYSLVRPHGSLLFSALSYEDIMILCATYRIDKITDSARLKRCIASAYLEL